MITLTQAAQSIDTMNTRLTMTESITYNPLLMQLLSSRGLSLLGMLLAPQATDVPGKAGAIDYRSDMSKLRLYDTSWDNVATESWVLVQVGSQIGTAILRKSITLSSLAVGANTVASITGGALGIEEISLCVTTTATSGGLATLEFGNSVLATQFAASAPVASLTAGIQMYGASPTGMVSAGPSRTIQNSIGSANIVATVGTAVFTAGVVELVVVYTPLTANASLA